MIKNAKKTDEMFVQTLVVDGLFSKRGKNVLLAL